MRLARLVRSLTKALACVCHGVRLGCFVGSVLLFTHVLLLWALLLKATVGEASFHNFSEQASVGAVMAWAVGCVWWHLSCNSGGHSMTARSVNTKHWQHAMRNPLPPRHSLNQNGRLNLPLAVCPHHTLCQQTLQLPPSSGQAHTVACCVPHAPVGSKWSRGVSLSPTLKSLAPHAFIAITRSCFAAKFRPKNSSMGERSMPEMGGMMPRHELSTGSVNARSVRNGSDDQLMLRNQVSSTRTVRMSR
mmetsp:Transcript_33120/g.84076  ORF Transcript_33120/g.84076 Transcript_33120/m.84076 type:complete len:247 (-) Transcript_33120:410-1150(-)